MWLLKLVDDNGDNMGQRLSAGRTGEQEWSHVSAGRTGLWSGIVRNEPGMVINLIFEIIPENSCILLGIPD